MLHNIDALFNGDSKILILGSFPSEKSRTEGFFYAHPQNRFWPVLAGILRVPVPDTVAEKRAMCLDNHVALWDVIASCDIMGSSDSSIKNVRPNDIARLLCDTGINHIFFNGQTAGRLYMRHLAADIDMCHTVLPSTSPANAAFGMDRLLSHWKQILQCLV